MKKFEFPLERVRQWRQERIAVEEAKLEPLYAGRGAVGSRLAAIREEQNEANTILQQSSASSGELEALDTYRRGSRQMEQRLNAETIEWDRRIAEQRQNVIGVRREFELLDKLKARKFAAWDIEFQRDLEAQAAEAYLSKWNKDDQR